ncbi:MAG: hypothetical protein BWX97_00294 [Firmicutes bacterium ADurb.Bin146]|jgi:hypothetical protein|nr:MAG: hypothetical protein BWX97_00294 [Firmicutes bacterium ADurb.Bin146]
MKKHTRLIIILICLVLLASCFSGCSKENKYINLGVYYSTDALSLYLSGVANSLLKVSTYVFFSDSIETTMDKISRDKQGIDISYINADEISYVMGKDKELTVVFVDCFNTDGSIRGIWIASDEWLKNTPTYSKKFIEALVRCADYRDGNMNMSYEDAKTSIEGMRDFDFSKLTEVMQYCAVFSKSNPVDNKPQLIADNPFLTYDAQGMYELFKDFSYQQGTGYELCHNLYAQYTDSIDDVKDFSQTFDLSLMLNALQAFIESK